MSKPEDDLKTIANLKLGPVVANGMTKIHAPWTDEQVAILQKRQDALSLHPYTCACHETLQPHQNGWWCERCQDFVQKWAFQGDFDIVAAMEVQWKNARGASTAYTDWLETVANGWLPMNTAPKDGRWFLCRADRSVVLVQWRDGEFPHFSDGRCQRVLTGWLPLPPVDDGEHRR